MSPLREHETHPSVLLIGECRRGPGWRLSAQSQCHYLSMHLRQQSLTTAVRARIIPRPLRTREASGLKECGTQLINYESYCSLPDIIALAIMDFELDSDKNLFVLPTIHHSNGPGRAPALTGEKNIRENMLTIDLNLLGSASKDI